MLCALKVSKIKSLIDCDLSARQSGLWFGAPKLKCGQINRKGNGSTEGMWNQISLTLWFLLTLAFDNVAPDNLHSRTNLSLFSFSSDSHPLAFLPFSVFFPFPFIFPPSVFSDGLFGHQKGESSASCECTAEAKRRTSVRQQEWDSLVGSTAEPQHGGADTLQVIHVCVCLWGMGV